MFTKHPRTQQGPLIPEEQCTGTAKQVFGMSEEEVARMAAEIEDGEDELHDDEAILD